MEPPLVELNYAMRPITLEENGSGVTLTTSLLKRPSRTGLPKKPVRPFRYGSMDSMRNATVWPADREGYRIWSAEPEAKAYVLEAKRRGLKCETRGRYITPATPDTSNNTNSSDGID